MERHVAALWRYPVKTLAEEPSTTAVIGPGGIPGDRIVARAKSRQCARRAAVPVPALE